MGLDFIQKTSNSFHKGLDQSMLELNTPNLFTQEPSCSRPAYTAAVVLHEELTVNETLRVQVQSDSIVALRGIDVVAKFIAPTSDLVKALEESYGEACGVVRNVYEIAKTAEITVC